MFRQWWCVLEAERLIKEMVTNVEQPILSWAQSYPSSAQHNYPWSGEAWPFERKSCFARTFAHPGACSYDYIHLSKRAASFPRSRPVSRSLALKSKRHLFREH